MQLGRDGLGERLAIAALMLTGIIIGAIGGLAGTSAMNEAQRAWTHAVDGEAAESAAGKHDARDWQERSEGQNSNEIAAQVLANRIVGRPLNRSELAVAAPLIHYSFGAAMGALYGAYLGRRTQHGTGIGFGLAVWLLADEIAMPLLGLSDSTLRRPFEQHLQSMAAHVVFGMTTEAARAALERQLDESGSQAA
jgi:putative membrane protein